MIIINACLICLAEIELVSRSIDHLLYCHLAQLLWKLVAKWFGCSRVFMKERCNLFEAWKMAVCSSRGRMMWKVSFLAVIWVIWQEIKKRCFEGSSPPVETLVDRVEFHFTLRVFVLPLFKEIPLSIRSWVKQLLFLLLIVLSTKLDGFLCQQVSLLSILMGVWFEIKAWQH